MADDMPGRLLLADRASDELGGALIQAIDSIISMVEISLPRESQISAVTIVYVAASVALRLSAAAVAPTMMMNLALGGDACMALAAVCVNSTDNSLVRSIAVVLTLAGAALMSVYWGFCAGGVIFSFMPGFPIHVYGPHTTARFAFLLLHSTTGLGLEAMFAMVLLRDVCFTPLPPGPVPNELRHASQARRAKPALSLHTVVPPRLRPMMRAEERAGGEEAM